MCHTRELSFFGGVGAPSPYAGEVTALRYGDDDAPRRIAVLPDIYGVTPFYQGFSSFLADQGARVDLVNPWEPFGDLPEMTREAAYERRPRIRDRAFCDDVERYLSKQHVETVVGFCIGGNFLLELVRRGYRGDSFAYYPLPWGMPNQDAIDPAFEYMPELAHPVTILMGVEDPLAGPENIERLRSVCTANPALDLHLYEKSGHGFLTDLESEDDALRNNALDAMRVLTEKAFPGSPVLEAAEARR